MPSKPSKSTKNPSNFRSKPPSHRQAKSSSSKPSTSKSQSIPPKEPLSTISSPTISTHPLTQPFLNIFRTAFSDLIRSGDLSSTIQEVKGHLYDRNFAAAFGKKEYLEAYAVRWSAARALGYLKIFGESGLEELLVSEDDENAGSDKRWDVLCIGGGAGAEVVAFAGWWKEYLDRKQNTIRSNRRSEEVERIEERTVDLPGSSNENENQDESEESVNENQQDDDPGLTGPLTLGEEGFLGGLTDRLNALSTEVNDPHTSHQDHSMQSCNLKIEAVDIADWASPLALLQKELTNSSSTSSGVDPFVPPHTFEMLFHNADVLDLASTEISAFVTNKHLITILFTLNELFSTSLSKTQSFLLQMTLHASPGTILLVVDSPGSYSTVKLGSASAAKERQYPMAWLLDHILLDRAKEDDKGEKWEKLRTEESLWFRLPSEGLKYEVKLENMRYQLHLFRRL